jgi:hypothetical protein
MGNCASYGEQATLTVSYSDNSSKSLMVSSNRVLGVCDISYPTCEGGGATYELPEVLPEITLSYLLVSSGMVNVTWTQTNPGYTAAGISCLCTDPDPAGFVPFR